MENLKYIIESLLFVSDTPIMLKQIHYIMPDVSLSNIRKAVEELTNEYNEREGSFYLSNVAGGIQLRSRPAYREWIKRFIRSRPIRLSRAALEALAIVAYKQPVTRSEVDKIRGVDSGAIMRSLVENKLIRIIGRKEVAGRPMLYTTSRRFLEVFDLNDLKDLPAPDDLEISEEDQAQLEEKFNLQPVETTDSENNDEKSSQKSEVNDTPSGNNDEQHDVDLNSAKETSAKQTEPENNSEDTDGNEEINNQSKDAQLENHTQDAIENKDISEQSDDAQLENHSQDVIKSEDINEQSNDVLPESNSQDTVENEDINKQSIDAQLESHSEEDVEIEDINEPTHKPKDD